MSELTELHSSDLLVHQSFLSSQHDPYFDFQLSQTYTSTQNRHSNDIINKIFSELGVFPKDTFVERLIDICNTTNRDIDVIRHELFEVAKNRQDFPHSNAILKKRLCPRKVNGDSIENKLASDCYVLYLATVGEFSDDLKNTLSFRPAHINRHLSLNGDEITASQGEIQTPLLLKDSLVKLESELIIIKESHKQDIETLRKTITGIEVQKENNVLKERDNQNIERLRNIQNQVNALKSKLVSQTETSKRFETDISNIASDRKKATETLSGLKDDCKRESTMISEIKDTIKLLDCELNKVKKQTDKFPIELKELTKKVQLDSDRVNRISDMRATGVSSLKAKLDLINSKVKDLDENFEKAHENYKSSCTSISDLRKRISNAEKNLKSITKTHALYSEMVKKPVSETHSDKPKLNVSQSDCLVRSETINVHNGEIDSSKSSAEQMSGTLQQRQHATDQRQTTDTSPTKQVTDQHQNSISVHFPRSVCHPKTVDNFSGAVRRERKQICRFYVGGINKRVSSEDGMWSYLEQNDIRVTFLRYFDKPRRRTASAQLNCDARDADILRNPDFWPDGIFIRDWQPWQAFVNGKHENLLNNKGYQN